MSISNNTLFPPVSNVNTNRKPTLTPARNVSQSDIRGDDIIFTGVIPGLDPYVYSHSKNILTDPSDNTDATLNSNENQFISFASPNTNYGKSAAGFRQYLDDILLNSTIKLACCTKSANYSKLPNSNLDGNIANIKVPLIDSTVDPILKNYGFQWKSVNVPQYMCPSKYGPPVQALGQGGPKSEYLCDDFINAYCMNEFKTYVQKTRIINKEDGTKYNLINWAKYSPICACYPNFRLYWEKNPEDSATVPRAIWLNGCANPVGPANITPYHDPFSRVDTRSINNINCDINIGNVTALNSGVVNLGLSQACSSSLEKADAKAKADANAKVDADAKAKADADAKAKADANAKAKADADAKAAADTKTAANKIATDKANADLAAAAAAKKTSPAPAPAPAPAPRTAPAPAPALSGSNSSNFNAQTFSTMSDNQKYMAAGICCLLLLCICICVFLIVGRK